MRIGKQVWHLEASAIEIASTLNNDRYRMGRFPDLQTRKESHIPMGSDVLQECHIDGWMPRFSAKQLRTH